MLVFGAGPLVGTLAPGACKTNFTSKSPVSQFIGTSGSGGHMGMLKFAGYDHLIVTGRASRPVYLQIDSDVKIREAEHLWGRDTWETTDAIWRDVGREYTVAAVGPAGENLVRDANIISNKHSAYGKTGMGAVMGSKNLKAIAVHGDHDIEIANPRRFAELARGLARRITRMPMIGEFRRSGTLIALPDMLKGKTLPIPYKNGQGIANEDSLHPLDTGSLERITEWHGNISCLSCPVGCKHSMKMRGGLTTYVSCYAAPVTCFAGICAVEGWTELLECCDLCNRLGIDYACASAISMAIELYQRGIIARQDTDGEILDWRPGVVPNMIRKIAQRKGFGNILADGIVEAARHIGRGADYYALHYKGVGLSTGDPRPKMSSWMLSMLTNVIGHASGVKEVFDLPSDSLVRGLRRMGMPEQDLDRILSAVAVSNHAPLTKWMEDYSFALECLGQCAFDFYKSFDINLWAELYSCATGVEMQGGQLLEAAGRGIDVRKAFNTREGASRKDDAMPARFLREGVGFGGDVRLPFDSKQLERIVTLYYQARGWDAETGVPTPERLAEITQ